MSTPLPPDSPPPRGWQAALLALWTRGARYLSDIGGLLLLALALVWLLGLFGLSRGVLVDRLVALARHGLGYAAFVLPVTLGVIGLRLFQQGSGRLPPIRWGRVVALELAVLAGLGLLALLGGHSLPRAEAGLDGGVIGWGLAEALRLALGPWLRTLLLAAVFLGGLFIGLGQAARLGRWVARQAGEAADESAEAVVSVAPMGEEPVPPAAARARKTPDLPPEFRKRFRVPQANDQPPPADLPPRPDHLPPLSLLQKGRASRPDEGHINLMAGLIEKTLAEFGIPARVVGFQVGPTVTQFAVEPGYLDEGPESEKKRKVRVAQIAALRRDLALALSATRLRIQAPVPGRPYVGIEVPNVKATKVRLRPILESEAFHRLESPLAVALGRDVSGEPLVADLSKMPHLLIAGTTGSGKSVCITAITTCLVMNNPPADLRLVMIDPKKVELVRFNGLPHLYGKVETEIERILGVLQWTVAEMDRRYKQLEALRARDIASYNRKAQRRKGVEPLPRIVVLIDELADLMMTAPDETETALVRLAQMARATGIHLVVATQRPSTDVVTGLIKANFPARISFAVASSVDSRVILDAPGAEHLLGRGDMLFLPPDAAGPIRAQGVWVSDRELEKVIAYWQRVGGMPEAAPPWEETLASREVAARRDDLVRRAIEIVQQTQRASASMLQRRLRVGYPRAARLIDELEALGVIGPAEGGRRDRPVLIGPDDDVDDFLNRLE